VAFEELMDLVADKRDSLELIVRQGHDWMPEKLRKIFHGKCSNRAASERRNSEPLGPADSYSVMVDSAMDAEVQKKSPRAGNLIENRVSSRSVEVAHLPESRRKLLGEESKT